MRLETYQRYDEADTRRDATCWNAGAVGADYNKRYQDTGFFLEKYAAHTGDNADQKASSELNWNNNLRIYRFSETLLNAAELIVRGAGAGDAQGYLDRVRTRAGLKSITANLDNIIEERHLEFVGEGKRYWTLSAPAKPLLSSCPTSMNTAQTPGASRKNICPSRSLKSTKPSAPSFKTITNNSNLT